MKLALIIIAALVIAGFAVKKFTSATVCTAPKTALVKSMNSNDSTAKGIAVVELFTSEGCSSCPPADALLAKLAEEEGSNVYVLSYHVDYWDRLGWKDAFSKPEWTARQAAYVNHLKLESAYTPQAVVNGSDEFVGSSSLQLHTSVDNGLRQGSQPLSVKATAQGDRINVSYTASPSANEVVNLALVQRSATSQVARGENGGRQLHHINVVRDLITQPAKAAGEAAFSLPQNVSAKEYKVIAYLQKTADLKITGATEAAIQ